jgi:hypothetical protein
MEVGQGPNEGCSAKEKKRIQAIFYYKTLEAFPADTENVLLV